MKGINLTKLITKDVYDNYNFASIDNQCEFFIHNMFVKQK